MSYPTKFNPKKFEKIGELLERLSSLEPGQRLIADGFSHASSTERVRALLYEWFYHQGLTHRFKIKRDADYLFITRKDVGDFSVRTESSALPQRFESLLRQMIEAEDPKLVLEHAELSPEEKELLEEKYLEVTK